MKREPKPTPRTAPNSTDDGAEHHEAKEVRERTAISANVVYEAVLAEGESELRRPTSALAFSGLAAGLSMGFSFLTQALLRSYLPQAKWATLVAKLGYPMGFLIVILGRQQLFTENTLTPILPLLKYRNTATLVNLLRLWGIVLASNWIGTIAFAWVLVHSSAIDAAVRPGLLAIGHEATSHDFGTIMIKGIFAGWLIALLVWLLPFAETGRVAVIFLMTYVIALGSFNHVVAGSVDAFYLVASHESTWGQYLGSFMFPTLIGNIIGGVSLVTALNHAQVTAGKGT